MLVSYRSFILAYASIVSCIAALPASACVSADALNHHILPTLPDVIDRDAVVLRVLLRRMPDWNAQRHDEATVSVLGVIRGRFLGRSVSLFLRPKTSCDVVGVVGRPGYVILKPYPSGGWVISVYHVENGRPFLSPF